MPKPTAVQRALDKFEGSPTKLAAAIGGGVLRQHVEHWVKTGRVPTEHCRAMQDVSGVMCWEFRPKDWWRIWPDLANAEHAPKVPPFAHREVNLRRKQRGDQRPVASTKNESKVRG